MRFDSDDLGMGMCSNIPLGLIGGRRGVDVSSRSHDHSWIGWIRFNAELRAKAKASAALG